CDQLLRSATLLLRQRIERKGGQTFARSVVHGRKFIISSNDVEIAAARASLDRAIPFSLSTIERTAMNYTILIYETPEDFAVRKDLYAKKCDAYWAVWPAYSKALQDAGIFVGGAGLEPPETATTLKFREGKRLV